MIFGEVPVADAVGALAAHSVRAGDLVLKKGQTVTAEAAHALGAAGIERIFAARLDAGDIPEDDAAARLAAAIAGPGARVEPAFTGRANLYAAHDGILTVAADGIDAVNSIDETITVATLAAHKPVIAGEMIATVKIIPYAVEGEVMRRVLDTIGRPPIGVAGYRLRRIGVVSTLTPGFKSSIVAKTVRILSERLVPMGAKVVSEAECAHEAAALADTISSRIDDVDLVVVFGASAIADRRDVVPAAIEAAGGRIEHFGMPVDPGNLLLLGELGGKPILGAPGCARSPKENGFDWVLGRLVAGLPVTKRDITRMGVGGLLMEIVSRPQPRAGGTSHEDEA